MITLLTATFFLVLLSAFFSGSEIAFIRLGKHRLASIAEKHPKTGSKASYLLHDREKLLSTILTCNTLCNVLAATFFSLAILEIFGSAVTSIASLGLSLIILMYAEILPKTIGIRFPSQFVLAASHPLYWLSRLLAPIIWVTGIFNRLTLKLLGIGGPDPEQIGAEELKKMISEINYLSNRLPRRVIFDLLSLERVVAKDVMVPIASLGTLDINETKIGEELDKVFEGRSGPVLVYSGKINNTIGVLEEDSVRAILKNRKSVTQRKIKRSVEKTDFVFETTPIIKVLNHLHGTNATLAVVVDEYGDIQGLIGLSDILDEIVTGSSPAENGRSSQGSCYAKGEDPIREINRKYGLSLPDEGANTLHGLIAERLEHLPDNNLCIEIEGYRIRTILVSDNIIRHAEITVAPLPSEHSS